MRVLLIKTSSFGDVVHALPAVTDAARAVPGLVLDWAVEPAFEGIARLHPAVRLTIPTPLRALRRLNADTFGRGRALLSALRAERYDVVVDAQGLIKSAAVSLAAHGRRHGLDAASIREPIAARAYHVAHAVPRDLHAIERVRRLMAAALGYAMPVTEADAGLDRARIAAPSERPYLVFVHGTTWRTKEWPVGHWRALALRATGGGYDVRVPAHGLDETRRAEAIVAGVERAGVIPPATLDALAAEIAGAAGVVAVDTGLAHLAAALGVPTLALYGPTRPGLTGVAGPRAMNLPAPDGSCPYLPCVSRRCRVISGEGDPPCLAATSEDMAFDAFARLIGR